MNKVCQSLNTLLADSLVFYVKLHNYHWNIRGIHFKAIHEATEELYEHFAVFYDDVAERILQLGDKPYVTMRSALEHAELKEESRDSFDVQEVLEGVTGDLTYIHQRLENLASDPATDPVTQDFCNSSMAFIEKKLWMIQTMLK